MNYTIKTANIIGYSISLDKDGNKYLVAVWNKTTKRIDKMNKFDSYDEAEANFEATCNAYGAERFIKEIDHDMSNFNFD